MKPKIVEGGTIFDITITISVESRYKIQKDYNYLRSVEILVHYFVRVAILNLYS